jgi:hypothetical protein
VNRVLYYMATLAYSPLQKLIVLRGVSSSVMLGVRFKPWCLLVKLRGIANDGLVLRPQGGLHWPQSYIVLLDKSLGAIASTLCLVLGPVQASDIAYSH